MQILIDNFLGLSLHIEFSLEFSPKILQLLLLGRAVQMCFVLREGRDFYSVLGFFTTELCKNQRISNNKPPKLINLYIYKEHCLNKILCKQYNLDARHTQEYCNTHIHFVLLLAMGRSNQMSDLRHVLCLLCKTHALMASHWD